jgi:uncharacterized protein
MTVDSGSATPKMPWRFVLIPSVALVLAAGLLGVSFVAGRRAPGTVEVVGSATVPFTSDVVKWRVTLMRQVELGGEAGGYDRLAGDRTRFLALLRRGGVPDADVSEQPVTTNTRYDQNGREIGVQIRQSFLVVSKKVEAVDSLALDPGDLIANGLSLENSQLEYFLEGIAALKRSLLSKAREDAQARAEEIAGDALGELRDARAGVFQIREPYSTEVQGYGVYSTATRAKEMTVTVHAVYALR